MSGKIKALAEQAKKSVPQGILTPDKWIDEYNRIFARLIIQECADVADRNSPLSYPDHGIKIKRHFGVD